MDTLVYEDQSELFQLIKKNRLFLKPYLPWIDNVQQPEDLENFFNRSAILQENKRGMNYKILYKNNIIGMIGFFINDDEKRIFELGYWLDKDLIGNGIISSIIPEIEKICFTTFNSSAIEIRCAIDNIASNKIAQNNDYLFQSVIKDYFEFKEFSKDCNVYRKGNKAY